jgi:hypothetical protein
MSGDGNEMIFHVRRRREHKIPCQERKITSDSMSGEEDNIRFHIRRER